MQTRKSNLKNGTLARIDELIKEYEQSLLECKESITNLEEELGECERADKLSEIQGEISIASTRRQSLETMIFDLKLKETEIEYLTNDNSFKNILSGISLFISVIATCFAIYLTSKQIDISINSNEISSIKNDIGKISDKLNEIEAKNQADQITKFKSEMIQLKKDLAALQLKTEKLKN